MLGALILIPVLFFKACWLLVKKKYGRKRYIAVIILLLACVGMCILAKEQAEVFINLNVPPPCWPEPQN